MKGIACLGWGSLIWNPGDLPVRSDWLKNGPMVRVEFARQSSDGRMTLVLVDAGSEVQSLWVLMDVESVEAAAENLRKREDTQGKYIGVWKGGLRSPTSIPRLAEWVQGENLDGVVWTALPPKFCGKNGRMPGEEEVVEYLRSLTGSVRKKAKEYVQKAPWQIRTSYRSRIEKDFHWYSDERETRKPDHGPERQRSPS